MSNESEDGIRINEKIGASDMFGTQLIRKIINRTPTNDSRIKVSDFLVSIGLNCADTPNLWLHTDLIEGNQNGVSSLYDYNHMKKDFQEIFIQFLQDLAQGNPLFGRNKPSSKTLSDGSQSNPGLAEHWHYHIGPYDTNPASGGRSIVSLGSRNKRGLTSGPVIHYLPSAADGFTIVCAAWDHEEFEASQLLKDNDQNWNIIANRSH